MIKKIQSYLNIVLLLFALIGVIYFVITLVIDMFKTEEVISKENLESYITQDNLVTSHYVFGILEKCVDNMLETYKTGEYSQMYDVIGEKTRKRYSKDEITSILAEYGKNILGIENIEIGHRIWLNKAYLVDNSYIAEIKSTNSTESMYLIINLDQYDLTYTLDLIT